MFPSKRKTYLRKHKRGIRRLFVMPLRAHYKPMRQKLRGK